MFDRVAVIGIGLIGSSLARALRRDSPETEIVACARRAETLDAVRRLAIADAATDEILSQMSSTEIQALNKHLKDYTDLLARRRAAQQAQSAAVQTD